MYNLYLRGCENHLLLIIFIFFKVTYRMRFQANPGPGFPTADVVQAAPDSAGYKEGARCVCTGALCAARALAHSGEDICILD